MNFNDVVVFTSNSYLTLQEWIIDRKPLEVSLACSGLVSDRVIIGCQETGSANTRMYPLGSLMLNSRIP